MWGPGSDAKGSKGLSGGKYPRRVQAGVCFILRNVENAVLMTTVTRWEKRRPIGEPGVVTDEE